ncbi:RNA recognition motif domain-containing protein [Nannocystaceae bacterium ST9]
MSTKLFVGGLPWAMDTQRLKEVFAEFGDLVDARVITDRETGRSRGFGFVTFGSPEGAERAIALDGQEVDGRRIRVDRAQEKERPSRPPGPGGGPPRGPRPEGEGGPPRSFDGPPRPSIGAGPGKPKGAAGRDRGGGGGGGEGGGDDYRRKPDKAGRGRRKGGRGGRGGGGEGGGDFDDYDY